jgi:hypothetical protein
MPEVCDAMTASPAAVVAPSSHPKAVQGFQQKLKKQNHYRLRQVERPIDAGNHDRTKTRHCCAASRRRTRSDALQSPAPDTPARRPHGGRGRPRRPGSFSDR